MQGAKNKVKVQGGTLGIDSSRFHLVLSPCFFLTLFVARATISVEILFREELANVKAEACVYL